ncbi:MAG TPA: UDP-N-acetylmuramoyl-L-alanyl-D-glutamate--2,6-diaminopimelate ligase [Nitrospiria bacterium]|nr:UDP-N-acetylmuramoyl-L-alanyl-D-glutamate--2,6-diaminopimelate ligase [Nitrospiria bacterium]
MTLRELANLLDHPSVHGDLTAVVTAVADDSAAVEPGALFVAVKGLRHDGHEYVEEAFRRGAVGAVIEQSRLLAGLPTAPCLICVSDSRMALRRIAVAFYGEPAGRLRMVGVTGTNGKTTTAYLIQSILSAAGLPAGLIGTIGYRIGERQLTASHTTPGLLALQQLLAGMVREGLRAAVMEVSSHALAQGRVEGCEFDAAVFTNLTQDHLDFHGTMENYFAAKRTLFEGLADGRYGKSGAWAVINRDDPWGRKLLDAHPDRTLTYGLEPGADVTAAELVVDWSGIRATIRSARGTFPIDSPLVGRYNVPNLLAAVGAGLAMGCDPEAIQAGIRQMRQVPGRFEKVEEPGQPFRVIVDYAHTDDALRRLLLAVRELQRGRVIVVFGCGGDRDRGKRPKMGRAAAELADLAVLTSDNPRSEEPRSILGQIEAGVKDTEPPARRLRDYRIVEDRRAAIGWAIGAAEPGDAVVIAGKGHEDYQIIGTARLPFDDRAVAREALRARFVEA